MAQLLDVGLFTGFEAQLIYGVAALGALGYLFNRLRKFYHWFRRTRAVTAARAQKFADEWAALNKLIQYQLRHNGGDSLLDMVGRIDSNHEEAKGYWAKLTAADTAIEQQLDYGNRILAVAFAHAPAEQQAAVTEWAKANPPPEDPT